jgi:acetyl esterase
VYAIDPALAAQLGELRPTDFSDIGAARAQLRETLAETHRPKPDKPLKIWDARVPGPIGEETVGVRVYIPVDANAPRGGLLYLHGGGFALGDLDMADDVCAGYAAAAEVAVVSVDYRLAPEHPFPAGLEDCFAALSWMAEHSVELGVDTARIGVTGESAGGGLAAALSLLVRDRNTPRIRFQLLEIPVLDDRLQTLSMRTFVDTPVWDRANAALSWTLYLGPGLAPGDPRVSPYAAPARALDLSGLPAAHVITAEFDPLRDEGIAYAQRLLAAGVSTELVMYAGTFHGSTMFSDAEVSKRMWRDTVGAVRRGLAENVPQALSVDTGA